MSALLSPEEYYVATLSQERYKRRVAGPFESGVYKGQLRRIRKCERAGMFVIHPAHILSCYNIITYNRSRKGRPYSMSVEDWFRMNKREDTVICFAVYPGPVAAAMCVKMRVDPATLYVQAWGDIDGQEKSSPVTLLCKSIYNWCVANGIAVFDVGTAPNDPTLAAFKERLGFSLDAVA